MTTVTIKRNDSNRLLQDTLKIDGTPIDFTGFSDLTCVFRKGETVVRATATSDPDLTLGILSVTIPSAVSTVAGRWKLEWEIQYSNNTQITVPTKGQNELVVLPDLG